MISPLVAFLVPCRAATCAISWAITPASSASSSRAESIRVHIEKAAGQGKRVISSESITLMVKGTLRRNPDQISGRRDSRIP